MVSAGPSQPPTSWNEPTTPDSAPTHFPGAVSTQPDLTTSSAPATSPSVGTNAHFSAHLTGITTQLTGFQFQPVPQQLEVDGSPVPGPGSTPGLSPVCGTVPVVVPVPF